MKKIVLECFACFMVLGFAYAQDGSYDTTFANNGFLYTTLSPDDEFFYSAATSPDGRIAVSGVNFNASDPDHFILMFVEDGSYDFTFGDDGFLINEFNSSFEKLFFQSNGKLVFGGNPNNQKIGRLLPNGTLDTAFGVDGFLSVTNEIFLKVDENDYIYTTSTPNTFINVKRFLPNGDTDLDFGDNGMITLTLTDTGNVYPARIEALTNGTFFVTYKHETTESTSWHLAKFLVDGSPDTSFGVDGQTEIDVNQENYCSAPAFLDETFLVSCSYWDVDIENMVRKTLKFDSSGTLDASFGTNGVLDGYTATVVQGNQRFIANSGDVDWEGGAYPFYRRFFSDGTIDNSFQFAGVPGVLGNYNAMLTNSGKFLVVGNTIWYEGQTEFILSRYNNNPLEVTENSIASLTVFPNPSSGIFHIESEDRSHLIYSLTDSNGRLLATGVFQNNKKQLDLSSFASGLYFLNVSGTTMKLIRE
ncbi:T9SS type A sorting domain-containing protein [Luteirhabdus pelagi]|uniref:T9SS type A sorting domain-containing protein n=1 Tax=Luteirhabdus pelagi TaxID=2792783 RepID=UPI00193A1A01|nr:T9SS type A sorting domain-containing protein [Luteirhabdus pelagi]